MRNILGDRIRHDFDFEVQFSSYKEMEPAETYYHNLVITDVVELPEIERFKTNSIFLKTCKVDGANAVCLSVDLPIFDSGDREYDSWHSLFLIQNEQRGRVDGIYCTGGYRAARFYRCKKLVRPPEKLKKILVDTQVWTRG